MLERGVCSCTLAHNCIKKGQSYWYYNVYDKLDKQVCVVAVDTTYSPQAVTIQFTGGSELDTDASRLSTTPPLIDKTVTQGDVECENISSTGCGSRERGRPQDACRNNKPVSVLITTEQPRVSSTTRSR